MREKINTENYKWNTFRKEINVIRRTNYYRSVNMSLYHISSKMIVFVTFVVYVMTGNALTSEKVSFIHVSIQFYYSVTGVASI